MDLVKRARQLADCDARSGEPLGKCLREMADRIEADAKRIAELDAQLVTCRKYRDAYAECDRVGTQALRAAEARVKELEAALEWLASQPEAPPFMVYRARAALEGEKI